MHVDGGRHRGARFWGRHAIKRSPITTGRADQLRAADDQSAHRLISTLHLALGKSRLLSRRPDALLTTNEESRPELSASILQAFLRAPADTYVRPTGRRCSSGRRSRSYCPFLRP